VRATRIECDFAAACVIIVRCAGEFRDDSSDRGFEIEQPALVEGHRPWRSWRRLWSAKPRSKDALGRNLAEAGSYVKRPRALWATSSPRKVTASEQARKARAATALFQDAECARKPIILRDEIAHQKRKIQILRLGSGQIQGYFVN